MLVMRARTRWTLGLGLVAWLWVGASPSMALPTLAGRTVAEALELLRESGLSIIYTTNVVRDGMIIEDEPAASAHQAPDVLLAALLTPHELAARQGMGGRWVIVPQTPSQGVVVAGSVHERDGQAVAGASVRLTSPPRLAMTDSRGHFRLSDVPPGLVALAVTRDGFVPRHFSAEARVDAPLLFDVTLVSMPVELDEIEVLPSRVRLLADRPSMVSLDRESLADVPKLGNDPLRALAVFPGTAASERSAGLNVRGGRQDEVMVLLDGLEILEPFHLREFDNALSIVSPGAVQGVELMTGAFPAEYGDRMSGVLSLTTTPVAGTRRLEVGLSAIDLHGLVAAELGPARLLVSARAGSLEPAFEVGGEEENPRFSDLFGKASWAVGDRGEARVQALFSSDDLDFLPGTDADEGRIRTRYANGYLWGTHQTVVGSSWLVETLMSASRLTSDRLSRASDDQGRRALMDEREVTALGVKQGWSRVFGTRHRLRWGFEARDVNADYRFADDRRFTGPLARALGRDTIDALGFDQTFRGQQYAVHVSERWRPVNDLVFEMGVRFDESALTDDEFVSPRLSVAWSPLEGTTVRAAWGHFYQSHRPHELRVEDGETQFQPDERAEHVIVGVDHRFGGGGWAARHGIRARVELYARDISDPRPRYENLFEPFSLVPELEPDRVRVEPTSSRARGLEVMTRGRFGPRVDWMVSYTRSRVEDRVAALWVPRGIDQPHALSAVVTVGMSWGLRLNAAWRHRSGWPTTAVSAVVGTDTETGGARADLVLEPRFEERLPTYHRLDLRLSRTWIVGRRVLDTFLEIQNAYGQRNLLGFEVGADLLHDGSAVVEREPIRGSRALPWAGVVWRF